LASNNPKLKSTNQVNQLELIADFLSDIRYEFKHFRTTSSGLMLLVGNFPGMDSEWEPWDPFENSGQAFDLMALFSVSVHIYPTYVLARMVRDPLNMEFVHKVDITKDVPLIPGARHAVVGVIYKALLAACEQYKPGEKA